MLVYTPSTVALDRDGMELGSWHANFRILSTLYKLYGAIICFS